MIYFIQDNSTHHIKIGYSKDPYARLAQLQTGNPSGLTLIFQMPGTVEDETALHSMFRKLADRGEWFRPGPAILKFIAANAAFAASQTDDEIASALRELVETIRNDWDDYSGYHVEDVVRAVSYLLRWPPFAVQAVHDHSNHGDWMIGLTPKVYWTAPADRFVYAG